ncbi:hypothetical protein NEOLEDRAFT_1177868 [Neolentinus lepideus HHB14362 ss-1]|uniref:Uncharacterized protein n=1 Tax=Neolentinus lepideus HHB14362 ss-1 TaxID=1314782 RepID=A0A165T2T1_9AGAM|nr:hypothetical protein NEOLEDRAFT_1177868 [Neolentinus lepideus HHB14362 ss-1]
MPSLCIWANCRQVKEDKAKCLQLAARCTEDYACLQRDAATLVLSDLQEPFDRLTKALEGIQAFAEHLAGEPALVRYRERNEITSQIDRHEAAFREALRRLSDTIGLAIQAWHVAEARRVQDSLKFKFDTSGLHPSPHCPGYYAEDSKLDVWLHPLLANSNTSISTASTSTLPLVSSSTPSLPSSENAEPHSSTSTVT